MNFAAVVWGITLVGTYRGRNTVSTEPATFPMEITYLTELPRASLRVSYSERYARRPGGAS